MQRAFPPIAPHDDDQGIMMLTNRWILRCSTKFLIAMGLAAAASCGAVSPPVHSGGGAEAAPRPPDPAVDAAIARASGAAMVALDGADARAIGWRELPPDADWKTILDPHRAPVGSLSRGTTAGGKLVNGAELPAEGSSHSIIDRLRKFGAHWGTTELVALIQDAGREVQQAEGGAPLRVGEMSKRGGGDLRWHHSHNSGRDADLAFYVVKADTGESVPAPRLLKFNGKGIPAGRKDLRFDVVRNWRLVEALLSQDDVNIQWLFVSDPLKALLLDHARSIGADVEIVRRAEAVLHQPAHASPHANHFHLRIGCSAADRVDGCLDDGPRWEWADWHQDALLARAVATAGAFDATDSRPKFRALDFLVETSSPYAADVAAARGFWDADAAVRDVAVKVVAEQQSWSANVLVEVTKLLASDAPTAAQRSKLEEVLRRSDDEIASDFLASRQVATDQRPPTHRPTL